MSYDYSMIETHITYQKEVIKRMMPPLSMTQDQAEMLVAVLMWSPSQPKSLELSRPSERRRNEIMQELATQAQRDGLGY